MNKENELIVKYNIGEDEIKLTPTIVQEYITSNSNVPITNKEFRLFAELCKARKLNPFLNEAYLIKYSANSLATMVVGKDAIIKRAVNHSEFNGMQSGVIVINNDDEVIERQGTFIRSGEKLAGGWARVYRKDWEYPIYQSVSFAESAQRKGDGELNANWKKQPATMIEKVAKVRALRETFVEELGGMYDAEEMNIELPSKNVQEVKIIKQDEETIEEVNKEKQKEITFNELQDN